jgi:hypothetical protein
MKTDTLLLLESLKPMTKLSLLIYILCDTSIGKISEVVEKVPKVLLISEMLRQLKIIVQLNAWVEMDIGTVPDMTSILIKAI